MLGFKIEIKWVDGRWLGFRDGARYESAGIAEITDLCRGDLRYDEIDWTASDKLVGRPTTKQQKISKKDQK